MVQQISVFERHARELATQEHEAEVLKPMLHTGRGFIFFGVALLMVVGWFLYAWYVQLSEGLGVTSMRTPVGAAWGAYIANFVFFVCLAHGGIAVAAAVRLFKLHKFAPIARIGEVLTVISIMMAGLSISIDMGRPDRIFNIIQYWPQRVTTSPLSWDVTVIIIYFTLSTAFLWLTLRQDMVRLSQRFPRLGLLYKPLLLGYKPGEEAKIERMAWWLALTICFLIVMLSGGVVAWIFGLLPARPGWFSAMMGPYFLTAAIASAIAAVLVVSGIIRKALKWETKIKPTVFTSMGVFLGITTFAYMYLIFAEQLTLSYAGPRSEFLISEMMLVGDFAPIFWPVVLLGFITPATYLVAQAVFPRIRSANACVAAAAVILLAFWVKRFLIVVPSLMRPLMPFPTGTYAPSWIEWSVVAGTFAAAALMFMIFIKVFPIMELSEGTEGGAKHE